jgi:hypothetical protein
MVAIMRFSASSEGHGYVFHTTGFGKVWIDPQLTEIARGSRWAEDESDQFPSDQQWSNAFEQMIT